ncbi:hypothetical protein FQA39_LY15461 [Lamprigera yunnana]|nr:hypothetical protein FQA39_LY15461 [Lamprigera yunnana]
MRQPLVHQKKNTLTHSKDIKNYQKGLRKATVQVIKSLGTVNLEFLRVIGNAKVNYCSTAADVPKYMSVDVLAPSNLCICFLNLKILCYWYLIHEPVSLIHLALVDISNVDNLLRIGRKLETSRAIVNDYVPPPRRKGNALLKLDFACLDALNPTITCGSLQSSGSTRCKLSNSKPSKQCTTVLTKFDTSSPDPTICSSIKTRAYHQLRLPT